MNKCKEFLEYFDFLVKNCKEPVAIPNGVQEFYDILQEQQNKGTDKPILTESGVTILEYMQSSETKSLKAKDIADGLEVSSRKVTGAMRKLTNDGFIEKFGSNPAIYSLTEKGKNFNIKTYKEEIS